MKCDTPHNIPMPIDVYRSARYGLEHAPDMEQLRAALAQLLHPDIDGEPAARRARLLTEGFGPIHLRKQWIGGPGRNVYSAHSAELCTPRCYDQCLMETTDFAQLVSWCWAALLLLGGAR